MHASRLSCDSRTGHSGRPTLAATNDLACCEPVRRRNPGIDLGFHSEPEVVQPSRLGGCNVTGVSPFIARALPFPASVLWTAQNRRCVVRYRDTRSTRQPLIEIVVYEHQHVLKRKFFVDTLEAADFAVTEFNITTERTVLQ